MATDGMFCLGEGVSARMRRTLEPWKPWSFFLKLKDSDLYVGRERLQMIVVFS